MKSQFLKQKKGLQLSESFGAVLTLVLLAVLLVVSIYMFTSLGNTFTANTSAYNATQSMITQFGQYPTLIGLVGTIIFLGLVIGVLVSSFAFGGDNKA